MSRSALIDRRAYLKGLGVSLALPLMDAMGWADTVEGKTYKPPVRLGFMYMPHGVIMDQFWPADAESFLSSPPPALESLRPILDQCLTMKGISGVPIAPFNGAPHALELSTWLTATLACCRTTARRMNGAAAATVIAMIARTSESSVTEKPRCTGQSPVVSSTARRDPYAKDRRAWRVVHPTCC